MPAWTPPRTWVAGEIPTAETFNTHIRDNLLALKEPPVLTYARYTPIATTSTSFVDMDAVLMNWTLVTNGGRLFALILGTGYNTLAGTAAYFDLAVDSIRLGDPVLGLGMCAIPSVGSNTFAVGGWTAALTPGTHTFRWQYRASAGTFQVNSLTTFIRELS